ncbi:MAG TPA: dihydrodipicolinate synthase family protein [Candidatus Baltobacteraceae bacterium]|nr:dihydrodipicolinate synthase family protein [Candidatus Baltobacteraceae bacterium]
MSPAGIYAATLTPFDGDLRPDPALAIPYYRGLLENGCDGLNVLGTTGESMSIGTADRVAYMEALAQALPRERLMAGTGASALSDAVTLTRACLDAGYSAALVIPPFYYRDMGDDGIVRFFDALFSRVQPRERSIMLYNFPRMSGTTFTPELVSRLLVAFPGVICGLKDSSNKLELEIALHDLDASLAIFPGSEALLASARTNGFAGCISGSVCLWPSQAQQAWRSGEPRALEAVEVLRDSLEGRPLIGTVRARVAQEQRNPAWLRSIPPL